MSLSEIVERRVFDDATTNERRIRVYVNSGELGLPRVDVDLMEALTGPGPVRLHIVGASGAGKTSLIMKVIGDLWRREDEPAHEVLVLRIGDRPANLASPAAVMKLVLDTIAAQGHRFGSIDPKILAAAAADQRTENSAQVDHRAAVTAPVFSYSAGLKEAYTTHQFGTNPARLRHDLEDVLAQIKQAKIRPVLVLDDTEKFVDPSERGTLDVGSVGNLYHHGVRQLGEFDVDLVVAMHSRFNEVAHVQEVVSRLNMPRLDVPILQAEADPPALRAILERRLMRDGMEATVDDVIAAVGVEELQLLYHVLDQDLRAVLKIAHAAGGLALDRGAATIEARDVRAAVVARR